MSIIHNLADCDKYLSSNDFHYKICSDCHWTKIVSKFVAHICDLHSKLSTDIHK